MADQIPEVPKKRGGRPKKYQTLDEHKAARRAKALEVRLAALPPLAPQPISGTTVLQNSIAAAVSKLTIPDAAFVTALCGGISQAAAYRQAHPGSPVASASAAGAARAADPKVAQAIAEVKDALAAAAEYGFVAFMAEMNAAIAFSRETRNATAMVRAVELKGKSTGHLSDKPPGGTEGFTLVIAGLAPPSVPLEAEQWRTKR